MVTDEEFTKLQFMVNTQRGAFIAMSALLLTVVRSLPTNGHAVVMNELAIEMEHARTSILNSSAAPDEMLDGFDRQAEATLARIRR